jgi:hypothetical protein
MIHRRNFHRFTFALAGAYNIGWGIYSALDPNWLFRFAAMPPLNHPEVFACLAMVVGLYGLVYLLIALDPENGWPLAAIGLLGKLLGPVGALYLILTRQWTVAAGVICLTNDLVWWFPFSLYLYDAWPPRLLDAFRSTR